MVTQVMCSISDSCQYFMAIINQAESVNPKGDYLIGSSPFFKDEVR